MKKSLMILAVTVFSIGLLSTACDTDDLLPGYGGGDCTSSEASDCADDTLDCIGELDAMSDTYSEDLEQCNRDWCDCLDDEGCDEYLDEAGCE